MVLELLMAALVVNLGTMAIVVDRNNKKYTLERAKSMEFRLTELLRKNAEDVDSRLNETSTLQVNLNKRFMDVDNNIARLDQGHEHNYCLLDALRNKHKEQNAG